MADLVIRNADVYDGTGGEKQRVDVSVTGATIEAVGTGLAPGFIDVHTHDDFAVVLEPDMSFKVLGGVTTCIVGNCGEGPVPTEFARPQLESQYPGEPVPAWNSYRRYLSHLRDDPPAVNVATLAGHGTVRAAAMSGAVGTATTQQRRAVCALIDEALDAGALGVSLGLFYEPGRSADREELESVSSAAGVRDLVLAVHLRDEGAGLITAVSEAINLAHRTGAKLQLSHHKAAGRANHGLVRRSLALVDQARAEGLLVHCDAYPYTAGSTTLEALLYDPEGAGGFEPTDIVIAATRDGSLRGLTLVDLADRWSTDPFDAANRLANQSPETTVICHSMAEPDVTTVMRHHCTMIGSDGLPSRTRQTHPRLFGSFARVLGRHVRELKVLSLSDAVYRMTGLPSSVFGLSDRGKIAPGMAADMVLFSPDQIIDRGTYDEPAQVPAGIEHVLVNGRFVVRDRAHTGSRPGAVLTT
jgi:N-acyl-D-aspartate/D-glutamate deacylase